MNTSTTFQVEIYRDGFNNLEHLRAPLIDQAFALTERDPHIAVTVEGFTARPGFTLPVGASRTEFYIVPPGDVASATAPRSLSRPTELARIVSRAVDQAQARYAATWSNLVRPRLRRWDGRTNPAMSEPVAD